MIYKIQYLKLGGILDQAINIIKDNFGLLFGIMAILLIPYQFILGLIQLSFANVPEIAPGIPTEEAVRIQQRALESRMELMPFFLLVTLVGGFVIVPLANAAVIQAVARRYLGQPVTAIEAIKHGFRRLLPLIGTSILMGLAVAGGFLLLIIPGILCLIWFSLSQHVVVIEEVGGLTALKRSKKLVSPHWATFAALGLVLGIISWLLTVSLEFVPQPHIKLAVSTCVSAITTMVWTAALVVFYFSCRCAEENFDLEYLAQSIGEAPPVADSQAFAQQAD